MSATARGATIGPAPVDRVPCDHGAMQGDLAVTGNPEADRLLNTEPLALLLGMLLDQHMQ